MNLKNRVRLLAIAPVLVAALAFAVVPASASAAGVLKHDGVPLEKGAEIKGVGGRLRFATAGPAVGVFECSSIVEGEVTANVATDAKVLITTARFFTGSTEEACNSPGYLGPPKVTAVELPWKLTISAEEPSTLKDSQLELRYVDFPGQPICIYKSADILSSLNIKGTPLIDTISNQAFTSKSSEPCTKEINLEGSYELTTVSGESLEL